MCGLSRTPEQVMTINLYMLTNKLFKCFLVHEEVEVFLLSAQVGGEWSAPRPCHFAPREGTPGSHSLRVCELKNRSGRFRDEPRAVGGNRTMILEFTRS